MGKKRNAPASHPTRKASTRPRKHGVRLFGLSSKDRAEKAARLEAMGLLKRKREIAAMTKGNLFTFIIARLGTVKQPGEGWDAFNGAIAKLLDARGSKAGFSIRIMPTFKDDDDNWNGTYTLVSPKDNPEDISLTISDKQAMRSITIQLTQAELALIYTKMFE